MEYEKCYILNTLDKRPTKKRKVDNEDLQSSQERRKRLYRDLWTKHGRRINDVLETTNQETLDNILDFIDGAQIKSHNTAIPTGIISGGPDLSSQGILFKQLAAVILNAHKSISFVSLSSRDASNLKNLLKVLIQRATSRSGDADEDEDELLLHRKERRLLNYDLQILRDWSEERRITKLVVAFEDSEAFDAALLAEVVDVFSASSIPFVLLFGIATSVGNFQDRLPRATVRNLKGQRFDAVQANEVLEQVFEAAVDDPEQELWLGPGLCRMLLDRQNDHFQSVQAFIDALKYACMSHFYANPVSLFINKGLTVEATPKDHFEATRNLQSFRKYAEESLEDGRAKLVRSLLDSDDQLLESIQHHLRSGRIAMRAIVRTLKLLRQLRVRLQQSPEISLSSLYIKAMSGDLDQSSYIRDLLLMIKKAASDTLLLILDDLTSSDEADMIKTAKQMSSKLNKLVRNSREAGEPLRSEHDIRHETLRTTVVAQKVELSKYKSSLTKQDSEYSKVVQELHGLLESHFKATLIDPKTLFMQEIFMYDIKGPHRDSFASRPRFVIERALSVPHDYLNCSCCQTNNDHEDESPLLPSNPPTSILYQLYLESGSLINVSDLYAAFKATIPEAHNDEKRTMALFQRALAELKYMGFVKPSRKKVDHVAKLSWKGL